MLEPWQWALAWASAFLIGVAKTGVTGLGILSIAVFATILPARESVGVVLLVLVAADAVAVAVYRREADWPQLLRLFPPTAVGMALGALTLGRIDDASVRTLIGGILVGMVALRLLRARRAVEAEEVPHRPAVALATGLAAGFTSMVANAAGPIMVLYLLSMRLPKLTFVGTSAWFFFVVNLSKVPIGHHLGLITLSSLVFSLRLIPVAIVGALSGRWLIRHIDQKLFETLALLLTLVAGLRLLSG